MNGDLRREMRCTVTTSRSISRCRVVLIAKTLSTFFCKEPLRPRHGEAAHLVRAARVTAVYFVWSTMACTWFMRGNGIVLTEFNFSDCSASDSPGGGRRVISDGTPHPPRRHQIWVPHVSGAGWGEHSVPATQAVTPAAPRPSALRTRSHDRLRHSPEPLASTVAPRAAPGVRRARSPPPTGAFVLMQSPSRHHRAPVTHVSLPSSSAFSFAPPLPRTYVHTPLVSFHLPPLFCVLGARLRREARHPTGGCGPVRDRSPRRVIAFSRSRCVPLAGGIRWIFGSGRHAGWAVFTVFSRSTPRRWVLAGPSRIARSGERGWFVKRAVSFFLGATAGCPRRRHAKRAGFSIPFSLSTSPVGACRTGADFSRGILRCGGAAGCVPIFEANRRLCTSLTRAKRDGWTVQTSLTTSPEGACRSGADCPRW